jgi:S1-C subfamily serine protease
VQSVSTSQARAVKGRAGHGCLAKPVATAVTYLAVAFALTIGATGANAGQAYSDSSPASINDYMKTNPDLPSAYDLPLLGIEVKNGQSTLKNHHNFDGVEILAVLPRSPGAAAGLQGERQQLQVALTVGLLAASMFFPPAMLGVAVLGSSGLGKSEEFIIAVDGERTQDVTELGEALDKAETGEVVYLTVVRNGRRKQLSVALPGQTPVNEKLLMRRGRQNNGMSE